jgi:hypothetical protein
VDRYQQEQRDSCKQRLPDAIKLTHKDQLIGCNPSPPSVLWEGFSILQLPEVSDKAVGGKGSSSLVGRFRQPLQTQAIAIPFLRQSPYLF